MSNESTIDMKPVGASLWTFKNIIQTDINLDVNEGQLWDLSDKLNVDPQSHDGKLYLSKELTDDVELWIFEE